jgi:subtilase family serine protease
MLVFIFTPTTQARPDPSSSKVAGTGTRVLIENRGNSRAGRFKVSLCRSNSGISYDLNNLLVEKTVKKGLGAGQSKTKTLRYTSESSLTGYYLVAVVDFENAVQELDELNNINPNRILIP